MPLNLLRSFIQWHDRRPGCGPIKTIDEAEAWVRYIAEQGFDRFYTETTRRVTRAGELEGGSVFFVGGPKRNQALFRMPLIEIEDYTDQFAIAMKPELIRVRQDFVGKVRGWRYLEEKDAPPDMPDSYLQSSTGDELPPEMQSDLKEMGLLT